MLTTYVVQMLVLLHSPHISLMQNTLNGFLWGKWGSSPLGVSWLFNLKCWTILQKGPANWRLKKKLQIETVWILFSIVPHVYLLKSDFSLSLSLSLLRERERERKGGREGEREGENGRTRVITEEYNQEHISYHMVQFNKGALRIAREVLYTMKI